MKNEPKHNIKEKTRVTVALLVAQISLMLAVSACDDFVTSYYTMIDDNYNGGGNELTHKP